jgi:plasmid stability protein
MRTTLNLDDKLYQAVKVRAVSEGKTVTSVIQEALRAFLLSPKEARSYKLRWVTKRGKLLPGINPDDRDSLYEAMDGRR